MLRIMAALAQLRKPLLFSCSGIKNWLLGATGTHKHTGKPMVHVAFVTNVTVDIH